MVRLLSKAGRDDQAYTIWKQHGRSHENPVLSVLIDSIGFSNRPGRLDRLLMEVRMSKVDENVYNSIFEAYLRMNLPEKTMEYFRRMQRRWRRASKLQNPRKMQGTLVRNNKLSETARKEVEAFFGYRLSKNDRR
jgi:pentatricopeptide repeat protein